MFTQSKPPHDDEERVGELLATVNAEREVVVIPHLFVALRASDISKHLSLLVVLGPVHHEVDEAVVVENPRVERLVLVVRLDFRLALVTSNHVGPFEELFE